MKVARGDECAFVSRAATGVRCIRYQLKGSATRANHYTSRTFENAVWNAHGVFEARKAVRLDPDLIVGHSGFGTTLFLQELYDCPPSELDFLRARTGNAMILLDACAAGYTPTRCTASTSTSGGTGPASAGSAARRSRPARGW